MKAHERLAIYGGDGTSALELLECVTGRRDYAERLADFPGGIPALAAAEPEEIARTAGIGPVTASRVAAAFRLASKVLPPANARLKDAEDVARWARWIASESQERFLVIGLDVRGQIRLAREIHRGSLTGVDVHPREVFRPLIGTGCASGVLAHNHPSGDPNPSAQDLSLTRRLRRAGEQCIGIPILDHVIVTAGGRYCSLADEFDL